MVKKGLKGGQFRQMVSNEEVAAVHETTLRVLSEIGLKSDSDRVLQIFAEHGAEVDHTENFLKIPESLVTEALKKAPSSYVSYARNPEYDYLLEGNLVYFTYGASPTPFIIDLDTREYRRSTKKDYGDVIKLGNALDPFLSVAGFGGAFDVPYEVEYEHEWEVLFNNTEKHIGYYATTAYTAKKVLEMAEAIVGGPEELRKRPIFSAVGELVSPLTIPKTIEALLVFAEAGIPVSSAPAPMVGATGPGTLAGTYVISNAETLALLTLIQLVNPGAPFPYYGLSSVMDPFTSRNSYGCPEEKLINASLNLQMAEYYGLPSVGIGPTTDAKVLDAQAGAEIMMGAMIAALAGINQSWGAGQLDSGSAGSLELALICAEVIGNIARILEGTRIDAETLAFDVIKEVGPGGNFLTHKHTLKHIQDELYVTKLFDRAPEETWKKAGSKEVWNVANEHIRKILKDHQPEPLSKDVQEKISTLVKEAERERVKA